LATAIPDRRVLTIERGEPIGNVAQQPTPAEPRPEPAQPALNVHLDGPDKLQHGEFASIKVRIDNSGTTVVRNVILDIVANGQLLKTLDVGTVNAERSVEVEVQMTPQVLGALELQAVAQSAAGERVVAVRSMFVGRPALTLAIAGRGTIHLGAAQSYTAIITNDGTADAEEVSLLVMLQGSETQSLALGNVLAGQTRRVAFELQPGQSGALSLNAVATAIGGAQASANGSIQVLPQRVEAVVEQASVPTPAQR
jgi:hypothetical protein